MLEEYEHKINEIMMLVVKYRRVSITVKLDIDEKDID